MKDNVRQELKELCYFIIENNNALSRPEQLTRVQMLYERLLLLNYLEERENDEKSRASDKPQSPKAERPAAPGPTQTEPKPEASQTEKESPAVKEDPNPTVARPISELSQQAQAEIRAELEQAKEQLLQSRKPQSEETPPEVEQPKPENESTEAPSAAERRDLNDEMEAPKSINDQLSKGAAIQVGLNDRLAFVKHLFNDSQEDFNRVLSQLNTLDTYLESMYFIENLVKPDYDWEDKKPYEDRLIELIKKRFGEDW